MTVTDTPANETTTLALARLDPAALDEQIRNRLQLARKPGFDLYKATDEELKAVYLQCTRSKLLPILHVTLFQGKPWLTKQGAVELLTRHREYRGLDLRPLSAKEKEAWMYPAGDLVVECTVRTEHWGDIKARGRVSHAEMQKTNIPLGKHPQEMAEKRAVQRAALLAFGDSSSDEDPMAEGTTIYEAPSRVDDAPADQDYWRSRWFVTVEDTQLDSAEARHSFFSYYTEGAFDSLARWLDQATNADAERMINYVHRRLQELDGGPAETPAVLPTAPPVAAAAEVAAPAGTESPDGAFPSAPQDSPAGGEPVDPEADQYENEYDLEAYDETAKAADAFRERVKQMIEGHPEALVPGSRKLLQDAVRVLTEAVGPEHARSLMVALTECEQSSRLTEGACKVLVELSAEPEWTKNVANVCEAAGI
jgi:hypothetical protein